MDSPVEAFVAVADGGSLVMAGAMQRTLDAFTVPSIRLKGAGLTCLRETGRRKIVTQGNCSCNAIVFPSAKILLI